jgi:hypothetical protein
VLARQSDKGRTREHRQSIFVLTGLEIVALGLLLCRLVWDNDSLKLAAYAVGMPVTFSLLGTLGLYLSWSEKT